MSILKSLAVATWIVLASGWHADATDEFLPVDLTCPVNGSGEMVLISENAGKDRDRVVIDYRGQKVISVRIGYSTAGAEFSDIVVVDDLEQQTDASSKEFATIVSAKNDGYRTRICEGAKEDQAIFFHYLARNKRKLEQMRGKISR